MTATDMLSRLRTELYPLLESAITAACTSQTSDLLSFVIDHLVTAKARRSAAPHAIIDESVKRLFVELDSDKSQTLSLVELRAMVVREEFSGLSQLRLEWLLRQFDSDGDGELDLNELGRMLHHYRAASCVSTEIDYAWSELEKAQRPKHDVIALAPDLERFVPFARTEEVIMAGSALPELEAAVIRSPRDAKAIGELRATIERVIKVLDDRIRERMDEDGIVRTCDRVIDIGNQDCTLVYHGAFGIIKSGEPKGLEVYEASVQQLRLACVADEHAACVQPTGRPDELYAHAALVHQRFGALVAGVRDAVPSQLLFDTRRLKKMSRILEKTQLSSSGGMAAGSRVCDIVRAMFVATSMKDIASLIDHFVALGTIEIVRVKDRFTHPSSGGWRDVMLNVRLRDELLPRHVCEVQIAHLTMVNARQGLPGHIIYARVRNATETLEKMGLERGETRAKAVSRRLETLDESGTSREEALAELMRLGVDEESLLAGGVTLDELEALRPSHTWLTLVGASECRTEMRVDERVGRTTFDRHDSTV